MLGKSRNWQDKVIDDPQSTSYEALHNGTAAAGLLGSIRVFPLVNLTPYRRHHEVAGAIAVGDQRDRRLRYPNTRSIKVLLQTAVELL